MSLIVTGSIGIDTVETAQGEKHSEVLGGSAIYFAAAASFFGPVRLVAAVGEDFPPRHLDTFRHFKGIDLTGLEQRRGSKTFRWHGKYHEDINVRDTVDVQLNILLEALPPVPAPFLDSQYLFLAVTEPTNQMALLQKFPQRKIALADTIDLYIKTARPAFEAMLRKVEGIVINDAEATLLTGERNVVKAGQAIVNMGPTFAVIKKGEHGSVLVHRQGTAVLPAFPATKVIDPTGAGDSFAGGMMGYLAHGAEGRTDFAAIKRAMACGTVVASFTIESFSLDRLKTLSRLDIDERLAAFESMLRL